MALAKPTIEAQIETLLTGVAGMELAEARTAFKQQLAQIIVDAIKSATITVKSGVVQVTGPSGVSTNAGPIVISDSIT